MLAALSERLSESRAALRDVLHNRALRRIELARPLAGLSVSASNVVFVVVAFAIGGAGAVGTVFVVRTLVIGFAAPFGALFGDRFPRERVMVVADVVRALALVAAALFVGADASLATLLGIAVVVGVVGTASAPARAAVIPAVARKPEELMAANVVANTSDNLTSFVAPALGGLLLAFVDPAAGFLVAGVASLASGLTVLGLRLPRADVSGVAHGRGSRFALAGFREIAVDGPTRLVTSIYAGQMLVGGVLAVLVVAVAADLLGGRESNVGFLYSALGVGGFVGTAFALTLGGTRLGRAFARGLLVWGVPIALVGAWPSLWPALALFAVSGAGDAVVDVAAVTLMQRRIPNELLARVGGAASIVMLGAASLGNVIAPLLLDVLGTRLAIVVTGAAIPALAPLWWRAVVGLDLVAPPALPVVRAVPMFALLQRPVVESIARNAVRTRVAAGEEVFRQGEPGDRFYVVADGELEILVDGEVVETAEPGDHFGEIALLRDEPRTATVRAVDESYLFALEREDFLAAVSGERAALGAAEDVAVSRLGRARPAVQLA